MLKNRSFSILILLLILPTLISGCFSSSENNGKTTSGHDNERDEAFFLEATTLVSDIFEIADKENVAFEKKISRINMLESFIDENNGYEFSSGAVFRRESTLMLIVYIAYIRIYENTDRCDLIYDYFAKFQSLSRKEYLIIKANYREAYDPVVDADVYNSEKAKDYYKLFSYAIGEPDCFKCELQPDPEWIPGKECYQGSSDQTR